MIGLLVFVVLKLQMITLELNWLRRHIVRVLTEQSLSSFVPESPKDEQQDADAFEEKTSDAEERDDGEEVDIELNSGDEESDRESNCGTRIEEM